MNFIIQYLLYQKFYTSEQDIIIMRVKVVFSKYKSIKHLSLSSLQYCDLIHFYISFISKEEEENIKQYNNYKLYLKLVQID